MFKKISILLSLSIIIICSVVMAEVGYDTQDVTLSSTTSSITVYPGSTFTVTVDGVVSSSATNNITAYQGSGEDWNVNISSQNESITAYQGGNWNIGVTSIIASSTTNKTTVYPGSLFNISGSTITISEIVNNPIPSSVLVSTSVTTSILSLNANRSDLEINLQASSFDISIGTFAISSPDQGFYLSAGTIWAPEKRWTSPIFGIAINGTADVRVIEYEEK